MRVPARPMCPTRKTSPERGAWSLSMARWSTTASNTPMTRETWETWGRMTLAAALPYFFHLCPVRRRRFKTPPEHPLAYYHCISRVVDRQFVSGPEEKEQFVEFMRLDEHFRGVRVVTCCVMTHSLPCPRGSAATVRRVRRPLFQRPCRYVGSVGTVIAAAFARSAVVWARGRKPASNCGREPAPQFPTPIPALAFHGAAWPESKFLAGSCHACHWPNGC